MMVKFNPKLFNKDPIGPTKKGLPFYSTKSFKIATATGLIGLIGYKIWSHLGDLTAENLLNTSNQNVIIANDAQKTIDEAQNKPPAQMPLEAKEPMNMQPYHPPDLQQKPEEPLVKPTDMIDHTAKEENVNTMPTVNDNNIMKNYVNEKIEKETDLDIDITITEMGNKNGVAKNPVLLKDESGEKITRKVMEIEKPLESKITEVEEHKTIEPNREDYDKNTDHFVKNLNIGTKVNHHSAPVKEL